MSPGISIREGIRWLPKPFSEPTRTVVLTSPENRFVDVRILSRDTTDEDAGDENFEDTLPLSRVDWAFAGLSASVASQDTAGTNCTAHAKWTHWVDSRHRDAEAVSDEGDMFALPDGRTLEKGEMPDPDTGMVGEYEEVWRDVPIEGAGEQAVGGERVYSVLVLENEAKQARGMVMQLGGWCQGVLRVRSDVAVERWVREEGKWRREVSVGRLWVPCGVCVEWERLPKVGGIVEYGEWEWRVVEKGVL